MLFKPKQKPSLLLRVQNFLWPRSGVRRAYLYLWHRIIRIRGTPHVISLGLAAGAFASFTPFVGLHFILGGLIALLVGGNILASALGTCVGNPVTFPFIWLSTFNLGGFLLGYDQREEISLMLPEGAFWMLFKNPIAFFEAFGSAVGPVLWPMLLGSLPLGAITGVIIYFAAYPAVEGYQHRRRERLLRRKFAGPNVPKPS